ncbi:MAG: hypothetical protein IJ523_06790 [Succinivibrionaceae bacterium]|nr:hypothetical protein [Succinivibrionaceae bacterium]
MEIIKKGNLVQAKWRVEQPARFECGWCGCQWEAIRGEYSVGDDYRNGTYYVMECPTCKALAYGKLREEVRR